jgi:hypothetical protein
MPRAARFRAGVCPPARHTVGVIFRPAVAGWCRAEQHALAKTLTPDVLRCHQRVCRRTVRRGRARLTPPRAAARHARTRPPDVAPPRSLCRAAPPKGAGAESASAC